MTVDFIWTPDIENILENIRCNCITMSSKHKNRYLYLKGVLRYFRIPIIILSGLNSVMSVGLQPYLEQGIISAATSLISLTCGIIGSIELFLAIQTQMENELLKSKEYYLLGIDIYKVLSLERTNRHIDGIVFLDEKFAIYEKLIESSNIINQKITDSLAPLPVRGSKFFGNILPGGVTKEYIGKQDGSNIGSNIGIAMTYTSVDKSDKDSSSDTTYEDNGDFNLSSPPSRVTSTASFKNRDSLFKNLKNTISSSINKKLSIYKENSEPSTPSAEKEPSDNSSSEDATNSTNDSGLNDIV
jgi:hypothetical protein